LIGIADEVTGEQGEVIDPLSVVHTGEGAPERERGSLHFVLPWSMSLHPALGLSNHAAKLRLRHSPFDDVADQLAAASGAAASDVEGALLSLLYEIVESLEIPIAALQDLFLHPLREA
jgi:hypothetical protein